MHVNTYTHTHTRKERESYLQNESDGIRSVVPYYRCSSESTQALGSRTTGFQPKGGEDAVGYSEGFRLCHWGGGGVGGGAHIEGNLEDSSVYTVRWRE